MYTHAFAVLVTGFVLAAAGFFPGTAHAQSDPAKPAVLDVASKPIGKVVVATGSVTLERANAVVVQASTSGPAGQAKVGDLVYQGDAVRNRRRRPGRHQLHRWHLVQSVEQRAHGFERVRVRPKRHVQLDLVQSDQGNLHFCRRQSREDGRYEDRHARRHHGRFEAPRHASKFQMMGQSDFLPSLKKARASSREEPGRPRRSNPNKSPIPSSNLNICRGC